MVENKNISESNIPNGKKFSPLTAGLITVALLAIGLTLLIPLLYITGLSSPDKSTLKKMNDEKQSIKQNKKAEKKMNNKREDHHNNDEISNDKDFILHMVPHHQEAIDSSVIILSRSQNQELKNFAQKVIEKQTSEISEMTLQYKNLYQSDLPSKFDYKPMMDLSNFRGVELDKAYIMDMIKHHKEAIDMTKLAQNKVQNEKIKQITTSIIDTQTQEIKTLEGILNNKTSIQSGQIL